MATLKTDINEVMKTLELFKGGELVEIRSYDKKKIVTSGYFRHNYTNVSKEIAKLDYENCYFTLNDINEGCYGREQYERFIRGIKTTTSDKDIVSRKWLLIDADPVRPSGVSSTDAEKELARAVLGKMYNYLRDIGFSYPIVADSGNGYHLLYNIKLVNNDGATKLIKSFLEAVSHIFSTDEVSIDTTVFNLSRITKLYGTVAKKGADTPERPHRLSRVIKIPDEINITHVDLIKKVADLLPQPDETIRKSYTNSNFNIDDFVSKYLSVAKVSNGDGYIKYVLNECPFDSNHKAPDSMVTVSQKDGRIGFYCYHASCSGNHWEQLREKFEPKTQRKKDNARTNEPMIKQAQDIDFKQDVKHFYQMSEIENKDRDKLVSIPTGIKELDKDIVGLNKGEWTIISGGNGSAKSTLIGQMILNQVNKGFKPFLFSGELTKERVKSWLHLQGAGRQFNKQSQYSQYAYWTPREIGDKIDKWMDDKFFIYNNEKPRTIKGIIETIKNIIDKHNICPDIWYIDNMMALDMQGEKADKYDVQSRIANYFSKVAKDYDVHIVFVCHPRKPNGFLRKADVSGTADLTNAVDNLFMCHRINRDFVKGATDFYGQTEIDLFLKQNYTNCIELMKNRDLGSTVDKLYGLHFEKESKRLLNYQHENICYGWQEAPTQGYYQTEIPDNPFIDDLLKTDTSMFGEV